MIPRWVLDVLAGAGNHTLYLAHLRPRRRYVARLVGMMLITWLFGLVALPAMALYLGFNLATVGLGTLLWTYGILFGVTGLRAGLLHPLSDRCIDGDDAVNTLIGAVVLPALFLPIEPALGWPIIGLFVVGGGILGFVVGPGFADIGITLRYHEWLAERGLQDPDPE